MVLLSQRKTDRSCFNFCLIFNRLPTPTLGYHLKNIQIVPIKTVGSRGVTNKQTNKQTDKRLDKQTE